MARVLIIDDEPDILLMLRVALESSGHEVGMAADGEEGLAQITPGGYDVVLCDMMMPVLDGWGVLEAVRDLPSAPPLVVVSAKSQPEDIRRALNAGAVDYITKPFNPFALVALVEDLAGSDANGIAAHRAARYPVG